MYQGVNNGNVGGGEMKVANFKLKKKIKVGYPEVIELNANCDTMIKFSNRFKLAGGLNKIYIKKNTKNYLYLIAFNDESFSCDVQMGEE